MWKKWNGDKISTSIKKIGDYAVLKTSDVVLQASKQEVPLDEKTLLQSGLVIIKNDTAVITYGGGAGTGRPVVPYAKRWHETQANFKHGRKWKYLLDPFRRLAKKTLENIIKNEARKII